MTDDTAPSRRLPATFALCAAAILAIGAIGYAAFRSDEPVASAPDNEAAAQAPSLDESIATLQQALRSDPDNHETWFMLGLALRDDGQLAEAGQAFRRAMELAPRNADYTAYLGEMVLLDSASRGEEPPEEAARLFQRALELDPRNAPARFYSATLKDRAGDHRGAVDEMIALLGDAPPGALWAQQVRQSAISIPSSD